MGGPPRPQTRLTEIHLTEIESPRVPAPQKFRSNSSRTAYYGFRQYLRAAQTQWNRVAEAHNETQRLLATPGFASDDEAVRAQQRISERLFLDLHFYLVCWDKMDKYLRRFERIQNDGRIGAAVAGVAPLMSEAVRGRNFFEHYDNLLAPPDVGPLGHGFGVAGTGDSARFTVSFTERGPGGTRRHRALALGRGEMLRVVEVGEQIIDCLASGPDFPLGVAGPVPP
jgi:hypothetical protein